MLYNNLRRYRTFQPRTFQPQASTLNFSTPDFSTMNSLTPDPYGDKKLSWWNGLGLRSLGLKCPAMYVPIRVWTFQPRLLNPRPFNLELFSPIGVWGLGLRSSLLKSQGLRSPGLKLEVEKSEFGMSCNA